MPHLQGLKSIIILIFFLLPAIVLPQPGNYYDTISTSSPTFVTDLKNRIRNPYNRISYDNFDETNIANFASFDNGNGTRSVICVYSSYNYIYSGVFTWGTMSREHTFAHSWMPTFPSTSNDQYSDQYHLFPTHQNNANNRRSNHPFGVVVNVTYQFMDGKLGTNASGQTVYEPRDIHKGDASRALFYMMVRYDGINGNIWTLGWLNGTKLPSLGEDPQDLQTLLDWNRQDPPDKWEVDRNNYIQSIQLNRNPFVDHPEYVSYIDFNGLTKLNPVYATEPANYVTGFTSAGNSNSIQVSWNDATGGQLPSGYLIVAYDRNNYFLPIDGSVYADDTVLTDGYSVVNIPYSNANNHTFSNLLPGSTYYFTIYSYNGSGSQINYKIDGTLPQTNATVSPSLAAEPTNYATNFTSGNITTNSIQLNWTDAIPGNQVPSGYLLLANNTNSFTAPSDGVIYNDDTNLADGSAKINIDYNAADTYTFTNLFANTNYYFKLYSYNGSGTLINYKTDGTPPFVNAATSSSANTTSILLDNFNRSNSNILGYSMSPDNLQWQETETVNPTSIFINSLRIRMSSTTAGREFANVNIGSISSYPSQFNTASGQLEWAINLRQSRSDPSGFDASNYGVAFILGKSTTDITTGSGYAVILGQSGSTDAVRLAKFTNGVNANSRFTNIISSGDYSNQYLSIKVTYNPAGNSWSLFVDSSSAGFPQTDPRNTSTQTGFASDSTYTNILLPYLGTLWNHATSGNDSLIFDDVYVPGAAETTLNLKVIIEGHYDIGAVRLNVKDTMKVSLRNSVSPYQVIDSSKSVIDSVTFTGAFNFANIPSGNYYIQVMHRNSIETWSKLPPAITSGGVNNYDFTTAYNKAYGDNLIFKNGSYCIYSGDVNRDGSVDATDILNVYNDVAALTEGYTVTDITGDNFVDISDEIIVYNNSSSVISSIVP